MYKLILISLLLIPTIVTARTEVPCKGGAGKGTYSVPPVCYLPFCDVGSNPSMGCKLADIPPEPPGPIITPTPDPTAPITSQTRTIVEPTYICVLTCNGQAGPSK